MAATPDRPTRKPAAPAALDQTLASGSARPVAAAGGDDQPPVAMIARVRLQRRLGRGGMGEVWLGQHTTLNIPVAVKLMLPALADDRSRRRRCNPCAGRADCLTSPSQRPQGDADSVACDACRRFFRRDRGADDRGD